MNRGFSYEKQKPSGGVQKDEDLTIDDSSGLNHSPSAAHMLMVSSNPAEGRISTEEVIESHAFGDYIRRRDLPAG